MQGVGSPAPAHTCTWDERRLMTLQNHSTLGHHLITLGYIVCRRMPRVPVCAMSMMCSSQDISCPSPVVPPMIRPSTPFCGAGRVGGGVGTRPPHTTGQSSVGCAGGPTHLDLVLHHLVVSLQVKLAVGQVRGFDGCSAGWRQGAGRSGLLLRAGMQQVAVGAPSRSCWQQLHGWGLQDPAARQVCSWAKQANL